MHAHRLALLWPEMYPRLLRIMDADPIYQDRIVSAVTAALIRAATSQAQPVDIPDAVRHIWEIRGGDREPTTQQWAKYNAEAQIFNGTTAMTRPAFMTGGPAIPAITAKIWLSTGRTGWLRVPPNTSAAGRPVRCRYPTCVMAQFFPAILSCPT